MAIEWLYPLLVAAGAVLNTVVRRALSGRPRQVDVDAGIEGEGYSARASVSWGDGPPSGAGAEGIDPRMCDPDLVLLREESTLVAYFALLGLDFGTYEELVADRFRRVLGRLDERSPSSFPLLHLFRIAREIVEVAVLAGQASSDPADRALAGLPRPEREILFLHQQLRLCDRDLAFVLDVPYSEEDSRREVRLRIDRALAMSDRLARRSIEVAPPGLPEQDRRHGDVGHGG